MTASPDTRPSPPRGHPADAGLRAALQQTLHRPPANADEQTRLDAAHTRWMQAWAAQVGVSPTVPDAVAPAVATPQGRPRPARARPSAGALGGWGAPGQVRRLPVWVGGMGVAAVLAAVLLLWQHQQNEALLDELSQVDVLSQMAAGEM